MADENSDSAEKTEEPTQRRLDEAVKKGNVAFSREVTSFFMIMFLTFYIIWIAGWVGKGTAEILAAFVQRPHDLIFDNNTLHHLLFDVLNEIFIYFIVPVGITVIAAFGASFIQNGIVFSNEPLIPKPEKISVIKGFERMFSMKSFMEFVKGLIKIALILAVTVIVMYPHMNELEILPSYDIFNIFLFIETLTFRIAGGALAVMLIVAVLDYMYQRHEYMKTLRMSKQELKDEFKQTEGSPEVKARLRQIRMERARQRMMQAVPDADVIIRNPTHYAVALKYDEETMAVPVVVAKGQDHLALRIIDIADEHDVTTVRNPPLARVLFDTVELDEPIPTQHYKAVAEVIGYVYRIKGKLRNRA